LTIRPLYLPALIVAGVLLACAVTLLAHSEKKAQGALPGKNGRIAYSGYDGSSDHDEGEPEIYTIGVGGTGKVQLTNNNKDDASPSYSPDGNKIAYIGYNRFGDEDFDSEIYTINAGGGGKSQVTNTKYYADHPSWGSRP
jgi:Tol biopolymer transport system component